MRKTLLTLTLIVVGACLIFYAAAVAAPTMIGATIFGRAVDNIAEILKLPRWAIFFMLLPPFLSLWRIALSKKGRKLLAATIIISALVAVIVGNRSFFHSLSDSAFLHIQKLRVPVRQVDPTTQNWFTASGAPMLFYANPAINNWRFFRAYCGAHDPQSGVELLPATSAVRQVWEAEQDRESKAEMTKKEEAAEIAFQKRIQQLQIVADSLNREKEDRMRREENFINSLIRTLQAKQLELAAVENEVTRGLALQSAHDANRQLDDGKKTLADAVKESRNGSPLDSRIDFLDGRTAYELHGTIGLRRCGIKNFPRGRIRWRHELSHGRCHGTDTGNQLDFALSGDFG